MSSLASATHGADAGLHTGGFVICTGGRNYPLNVQDWELGARLASQGERVVLVLNGQAGLAEHSWSGCQVVAWPSGSPASLADARFFWNLLGRERPRAVLANFTSVHMAMLLALARGVPGRVAWYRTLRAQSRLDSDRSWWGERVAETGKAVSMWAATHAVAVSPTGKRDLCRYYPVSERNCAVFHSCRPDPLQLLGDERPMRSDRPSIVCVGRLIESKGQDLLLHAFARIHAVEPDWRLVLVGTGRLKKPFEALARELGIAEHVKFTGGIPLPQVYRHMAQAHVAAFPGRSDPGPGAVAEALGLGLPVVATTRTGAPELAGDSSAIALVAPDDAEALAETLLAVLRDEGRMAEMRQAARELFLSRFHLDHWVQGVSGWLRETVLPTNRAIEEREGAEAHNG